MNKKRLFAFLLIIVIIISVSLILYISHQQKIAINSIVLITIDALRSDHLGCYEYPRNTSPFIDDLAEKGILFLNAFSSISHTSPALASIFTSLYPVQHKLLRNGESFDKSIFTMAEMFRNIDYETIGFSSVRFLEPLKKGFNIFDCHKKGSYYRQANSIVDSAINFFKEKKPSDKFFLWLHFYDPHRPYIPPEIHLEKMETESQDEKNSFVKYLSESQKIPLDFYKNYERLADTFINYDAEIFFVDREIKRLFDYMDKSVLNMNTLWIITADHGEGMGNHNYAGHGKYIYNEQLHIPLIFYFSNRTYTNTKIKQLVRHVDILPTLSDLVGTSLKKQTMSIQGCSLLPLIRNKEKNLSLEYAFSQRRPKDQDRRKEWETDNIYCLQDLKFKYIYHSERNSEFYNLIKDPFELDNLIDAPSNMKDKMKKILEYKYHVLRLQSKGLAPGQIDKKYREELRALGYIK